MNPYAAVWVIGQLTALAIVANWAVAWATGRPRSYIVENIAVAVLLVLLGVFVILINFGGGAP